MDIRIGIGHDTHRLAEGGPLILGGVEIPHDRHALGHSDADVLLHALTDALLGAVAMGDIGEWFPDTDPANRGKNSAEMLAAAVHEIRGAGYEIVSVDAIVFAQRPKLSPYKVQIAAKISEILGTSIDRVGVKAKTGEGIGDVGEERIIQAQAVALLRKN